MKHNDFESLKTKVTENDFMKKIMRHPKWIGIGAAVAVILIALIVIGYRSLHTVDLFDYYSLSYTGGNGNGTAHVEVDYEGIAKKVMDGAELEDMIDLVWDADIEDNIQVTVDPKTGLKNGDTVKVSFEVPKDLEINGNRIKGGEKSVKVKGLENYKEISTEDLFGSMKFVYEGASPFLDVSVENVSDDPFLSTVRYDIEKGPDSVSNNYFQNGEEITVTATWDETVAEKNKCMVTGEALKTFQIEGQDEYITEEDQVTEEVLAEMQRQVDEYVESSFEQDENSDTKLNGRLDSVFAIYEEQNGLKYNRLEALYEVQTTRENGEIWTRYAHVKTRGWKLVDGKVEIDDDDVFDGFLKTMRTGYDNSVENLKEDGICFSIN